MKTTSIRICGFGGQGIILSAVILGTAIVEESDMYAVQTQSYGSEARGGQCQSEIIISEKPINSPSTQSVDILIALSGEALETYLQSLKPYGVLIIDSKLTNKVPESNYEIYNIPATETAAKLGNTIVANMVVLGFFQEITELISKDELIRVVSRTVPGKFRVINIKAIEEGIKIAKNK